MELTIIREGTTFSGKPCYYLDSDEGVDQHGNEVEDGEHFTPGFFGSPDEAREWAAKHGHTVAEEE